MADGIARRTLFRAFLSELLTGVAGGVFIPRSWAGALQIATAPRSLLRGFHRTQIHERRYRADAAVIFCGATIFTRRSVGGAYASIETGQSGATAAMALQFAAGSEAVRSAEMNRFGILQEAVIESGVSLDFAFAGLITDSNEGDDLDQARKALHDSSRQQVKFARGSASEGRVQTWIETIELTRSCAWTESANLLATLEKQAPRLPAREIGAGAGPFLAAIHRAALSEDAVTLRPFLRAGKQYSLELRRRSAGQRDGLIRDENGAKSADFRVLYAAGDTSGVPTRIEYRAKPYLKLIFDADESVAPLSLMSLFSKEA